MEVEAVYCAGGVKATVTAGSALRGWIERSMTEQSTVEVILEATAIAKNAQVNVCSVVIALIYD